MASPWLLQSMLVRAFLPVFFSAALMFMLVLQLADVFPQLFRYIANDVPVPVIARIALLYTPTTAIFALPFALLFSVTYTLGQLYARNELVAVFGAGVSLRRLVTPLLAGSVLLCGGLFVFENDVAIPTLLAKNQLFRSAVNIRVSLNDSNVAVTSGDGRIIYHTDHYHDERGTLTGVLVVVKDAAGGVVSRLDAERAVWRDGSWNFENVRHFSWRENGTMQEASHTAYRDPLLSEPPATFRRVNRNVAEMTLRDALATVDTLRRAGREFREALTETYAKVSFALTPLAVTLVAAAVGGLLRRNVLLLSLSLSVGLAVVFFVVRMASGVFAKGGLVPPAVGAFAGVLVFLLAGTLLFRAART
jgi:lipopolysaccharide export system permease protein